MLCSGLIQIHNIIDSLTATAHSGTVRGKDKQDKRQKLHKCIITEKSSNDNRGSSRSHVVHGAVNW